ESLSEPNLRTLRADYDLGTCPVKPDFLLLTADVQRDCIYWLVRAWGANEESWLIYYGRSPAITDLDEIAARQYPIAGTSETLSPWRVLIDSGFAAQQVYEYCAPMERSAFPCKGWDHLSQPVKESEIQFLSGRDEYEQRLLLFHFDDSIFKGELYLR